MGPTDFGGVSDFLTKALPFCRRSRAPFGQASRSSQFRSASGDHRPICLAASTWRQSAEPSLPSEPEKSLDPEWHASKSAFRESLRGGPR
jgi:hypothetical protein